MKSFLNNIEQIPLYKLSKKERELVNERNPFISINIKKRLAITNISTEDLKRFPFEKFNINPTVVILVKGFKKFSEYKLPKMYSSTIVKLVIQAFLKSKENSVYFDAGTSNIKLYSKNSFAGYFYTVGYSGSYPFLRYSKIITPSNQRTKAMKTDIFFKRVTALKTEFKAYERNIESYNKQLNKLLALTDEEKIKGRKLPKFTLKQVKNNKIEI